MSAPSEPFAAVYEDRNRLGVIVARTGRGGFEAYAADDHCLGLFPTPREAAAAITMTRPWVEPRRATFCDACAEVLAKTSVSAHM
jgi:hypothetical protein